MIKWFVSSYCLCETCISYKCSYISQLGKSERESKSFKDLSNYNNNKNNDLHKQP